ncbi:hypothetical protein NBRC110019_01290 [Neptunitalea chrysea]|uniref:Uncharacterized protein n=1 Tax=Neptunitalea chrysea TaxID=1647581 RepID=A0A9W6B3W2_9FLAO|nr:hypothetical protein [Neptunitalea chrysea]GLB51090.1 hypothetical protein NBRC110019_01290 [Neptunitalea chrysea]
MNLIKLFSKTTGFFETTSHMAFAISEDSSGSSKAWQISWGKGVSVNLKVKKLLKKKGFGNIKYQSPHEEHGHFVVRGFWVVVKCSRNQANQEYVSYGMGADQGSYQHAEEKALLNLRHYDTDWNDSYGYSISRKGIF